MNKHAVKKAFHCISTEPLNQAYFRRPILAASGNCRNGKELTLLVYVARHQEERREMASPTWMSTGGKL